MNTLFINIYNQVIGSGYEKSEISIFHPCDLRNEKPVVGEVAFFFVFSRNLNYLQTGKK